MPNPPPYKQLGLIEGAWVSAKRYFRPLSIHQLPSLRTRHLRQISDDDLFQLAAGYAPNSKERLACDAELKRREGRTARLALAISVLSLVVSILAELVRTGR